MYSTEKCTTGRLDQCGDHWELYGDQRLKESMMIFRVVDNDHNTNNISDPVCRCSRSVLVIEN